MNCGILPLTFDERGDYDRIEQGDVLENEGVHDAVKNSALMQAALAGKDQTVVLRHDLSPRRIDVFLAGGAINWLRERRAA